MYGPSKSARAGNDTYKISQSSANFIWDGSGEDVIDLSSMNKGSSVYLTPGFWGFIGNTRATNITSAGQITINFGTVVENLIGSKHSDKLFGNEINNSIYGGGGNDSIEGWSGDDLLFGEAGDDQLVGGDGNDVMDGGMGTDTVVFSHNQNYYSFNFDSVTKKYTVSNVNGKDGIDTLLNVEFLKFADKKIGIESVSLEIKPPPNIEIKSNSLSLINSQTATITFTLSESSENFNANDVIVSGGTLSKFTGDGVTFTALFTPTPNSITSAFISVPSGAFTNSKGVANNDGTDANNMLKIFVNTLITPVIVNEKHDLSIVSYKNIKLGGEPVYIKGIIENLTYSNGVITSHTIEIDGSKLNYMQVDGLITTVTRDGEFTQEFTKEINDYLKTDANITYQSAVALVGVQSIDGVILFVAGADGDYVN
jgi:hypothetical protein